MKRIRSLVGVLLILISGASLLTSCTKVLVRGKDKDMEPVSRLYYTSPDLATKAGREALIRLGYRIDNEDASTKTLTTNWQSTKAASHYIDLFDRRDYGTVGAYYRLKLQVIERVNGQTEVAVSAPVRSIITGRLYSSNREEKKVLKKIQDLLRTDDFEITNVGVEEK